MKRWIHAQEVSRGKLINEAIDTADSDRLRQLANSEHRLVKVYVAKNRNTPVDVLNGLSDTVPEAVAQNINTPTSLLDKLSNDHNWKVREGVAENRNTALDTRIKLLSDPAPQVREGAILGLRGSGDRIPKDVYIKLLKDDADYVKKQAALMLDKEYGDHISDFQLLKLTEDPIIEYLIQKYIHKYRSDLDMDLNIKKQQY